MCTSRSRFGLASILVKHSCLVETRCPGLQSRLPWTAHAICPTPSQRKSSQSSLHARACCTTSKATFHSYQSEVQGGPVDLQRESMQAEILLICKNIMIGMELPGMGPLTLGLSKRSQARLARPRRWLWCIEVYYKLRWCVWRLRGFPTWRALQSSPASAGMSCAELGTLSHAEPPNAAKQHGL